MGDKEEGRPSVPTASQAAQPTRLLSSEVRNLPYFNPREDPQHPICALETMEAFIRAVFSGKRDFRGQTKGCIVIAHRGNGTAGVILHASGNGIGIEAL